MIKLNYVRGDVSDVSAKTAALQGTYASITLFAKLWCKKECVVGWSPKLNDVWFEYLQEGTYYMSAHKHIGIDVRVPAFQTDHHPQLLSGPW